MSTFQWVNSSASSAPVVDTSVSNTSGNAIPANAIVRRFVVWGTAIGGWQSVTNVSHCPDMYLTYNVVFTATDGVQHVIFQAQRRIPSVVAALYDPNTAERVYSRFHTAGDQDLGCNESCNRGRFTDPNAKSMDIAWSIGSDDLLGVLHVAGLAQVQMKVLYETMP